MSGHPRGQRRCGYCGRWIGTREGFGAFYAHVVTKPAAGDAVRLPCRGSGKLPEATYTRHPDWPR